MIHYESAQDFIVLANASIEECMLIIAKNLSKIAFVCDNARVIGSISDGDIRRHLLREGAISDKVDLAMHATPITLSKEALEMQGDEFIATTSLDIDVYPVLDQDMNIIGVYKKSKTPSFPIYSPTIDGNELKYVAKCLESNWISSQGPYVKQFGEKFESLIGHGFRAIAVSNGTSALFLALKAFGIGAGDRIAVPSLTFAATANAIIHTGAVPVFLDVDPQTWCITPESLKEALKYNLKGFISVDLYGNSCSSDELRDLANKNDLIFIEDAAEALGTLFKGTHVGKYSDAVTFSFFGNKTITTGEGGMLCLKDKGAFDMATLLRDHGMDKSKRYWHNIIGYNLRLTNIQAALGVAQMEKLDATLRKKSYIYELYFANLKQILEFQVTTNWCKSSFWLISALTPQTVDTSLLIENCKKVGIDLRRGFYPLHTMPPYIDYNSTSLMNTLSITHRLISLPSYPSLSTEDINYISEKIKTIIIEMM